MTAANTLCSYILKQLVLYESDVFESIESVGDEELEFDAFMSEVEDDYSKYYVEGPAIGMYKRPLVCCFLRCPE